LKGFGIYVKNNLLEAKHIDSMGESVWLYMWLLDKMTSVNENGMGKVLGGKPITHAMVELDLGIEERRYQRWLKRLRDAGYVRTLRTPYGLVITINKAEKIFRKSPDKNVVSKKSKSDTTNVSSAKEIGQNRRPDTTKMSGHGDKNVVPNKDNTVDNTKTITNVITEPDKPVRYGQPGINEMFDFWAAECGFNIESRVKANRAACSNLLKKHGKEKLEQLIRGVSLTHSDQYAPSIADFSELQQKLPTLLVWGRKKHGSSGVTVIS
jgi:hypothetical protein